MRNYYTKRLLFIELIYDNIVYEKSDEDGKTRKLLIISLDYNSLIENGTEVFLSILIL